MSHVKETAQEALERYVNIVKNTMENNVDEQEDVEECFELLLEDEWKMSEVEIKREEESFGVVFSSDIVKFKKEIGNFQIGTQDEDDYGNENTPVVEFVPLLEWWARHTDLDDEFNGVEASNESLRERLSDYLLFFSETQDIDSVHYCLDKASYNKETNEMNIVQFHQDSWWYLATSKVETSKEIGTFDNFISEFIDDKVSALADEC